MSLNRALRFCASVFVVLFARAARADDVAACPRHGTLRVLVAPRDDDPTLARRTLDQIFSELAKRTAACPATSEAPLDLEVTWRPSDHVLVRLRMSAVARDLSLERDVDLTRVPQDGLPLAIAIVADELLAELFGRVEDAAPRHEVPTSSPRVPVVRPRPEKQPSFRLGLRATHRELTSGLGLTGIDVELAWLVTPYFQAAFRGGPRAVSWVSAPQTEGHAYDLSALAIVGTNASAERGIAAELALDVMGIGSQARASPALGGYAWQKISRRFVLSLDARFGGVLSDPAEFSALSGACVTVSVGIATEW